MDELGPKNLKDLNLDELIGRSIYLDLWVLTTIHFLDTGEKTDDFKKLLEYFVQRSGREIHLDFEFDEVFVGHPEDAGEIKTKEALGVKVRLENRPVYTGSRKQIGDQSLGDLFRQGEEIREELTKRLLAYKTRPYIGMDKLEGIIVSTAASLLHDSHILEERLRTQFKKNLDGIVKRYKKLPMFFVEEKPSKSVLNRLREAINCYTQGYYQSCAIMCRAVLETAIRGKIKNKTGTVRDVTLGKLLGDAKRFGFMTEEDYKMGLEVKDIGDAAVHDAKRCSTEEAYKSLEKTKVLLNKLFTKE